MWPPVDHFDTNTHAHNHTHARKKTYLKKKGTNKKKYGSAILSWTMLSRRTLQRD
jgi:hypothetical protein